MQAAVDIFESAAKVSNEWSLAAFTIAALFLVALLLSSKKASKNLTIVLGSLAIGIFITGLLPHLSRAYIKQDGIYRVRVTIEDPNGMPLDSATVTSSFGGEAKRVEGGWQFDIPVASKPRTGKATIYARQDSAFLSGKTDVDLAEDLNIAAKIRLLPDVSAHLLGRVVDSHANPVTDVVVSLVGHESESVRTGPLGQFDLPAHAAEGQLVQVAAYKKGRGSISEWKAAGTAPITLVLSIN